MKLLLSTRRLSERGGTETYLLTLARELQRLGHDVTVHASEGDRTGELADEAGVKWIGPATEVPTDVDAVVVQDAIVAYEIADRLPETPQLYVAHSAAHDLQLPPQLPDVVGVAVAMSDRVADRLRSTPATTRVERLRQPVDLDLFRRPTALPPEPRRLLSLGHRMTPERRDILRGACADVGIEYFELGSQAGNAADPTATIASSDIVVGYGRCVVEAMMAGRAAFVYDHSGGDGWVTAASYERIEADGFVGRSDVAPIDRQRLVEQLRQYDPEMGLVNRDLAVTHHNASEHAVAIVGLLESLAPRGAPIDEAAEFARLVRLAWHWEASSIQLQQELASIEAQIQQLRTSESDLARREGEVRAVAEEAERALAEWRARAERAEADVAAVHADRVAFEATRSFRLARVLARMSKPFRRG